MEVMTAADRLKTLRKTLTLNQSEFAEKLGLTFSAISLMELGKTKLTEQNIKHIALTFDVNEEWLRNGAGSMFVETIPGERELLSIFRSLPESMCELYLKIGRDILSTQLDQ
jgi:transcriptional regulator with XRE-family HTH domain